MGRVLCHEASIEVVGRFVGRTRATTLLLDAARCRASASYLGELLGGNVSFQDLPDDGTVAKVIASAGDAYWNDAVLSVRAMLPDTVMNGIGGRALGDVVAGAGCEGRRIVMAAAQGSNGPAMTGLETRTLITVDSGYVDLARDAPSSTRSAVTGRIRRLWHGWRQDFLSTRNKTAPTVVDTMLAAMLACTAFATQVSSAAEALWMWTACTPVAIMLAVVAVGLTPMSAGTLVRTMVLMTGIIRSITKGTSR